MPEMKPRKEVLKINIENWRPFDLSTDANRAAHSAYLTKMESDDWRVIRQDIPRKWFTDWEESPVDETAEIYDFNNGRLIGRFTYAEYLVLDFAKLRWIDAEHYEEE